MCLRPLRSKNLMGGWDIAPMHQIPFVKTDFEERGVATCSQQWKTPNIRKRKPAGRFHADNNQKECGPPPLAGKYWSNLNPPVLSTDKKLTSATTNVLLKENWQKLHIHQEDQGPQ